MSQRIVLLGATGLVGQGVLKSILQDPGVSGVTVLVRKPFTSPDPRVSVLQVAAFGVADLSRLDLSGHDACFYCAGVLPVGLSAQQYRAITVDLTHNVAMAYAQANPHGRFLYVSGMGANSASNIMPMKVKGEAEDQLQTLGIPTCHLRPGVVQPVQAEVSPYKVRRLAYVLGTPLLTLGRWLAPSAFTSTQRLGKAMVKLAAMPTMPLVLENRDINQLGA